LQIGSVWIKITATVEAASRMALGLAGTGLPTTQHLEILRAHARTRDAVHQVLDTKALEAALKDRGHDALVLHSSAADRHI
jgi:ethanolamine ammonia-lyase small subunit